MDPELELITEQLRHTLDLLKAELDALNRQALHDREMAIHRITQLEENQRDHEARLRALQDGVTSFKVWSGLASGGSSLVALIALLRAILGG